MFREFQRLDQGARSARGLGLGLSIVERIGRVLDHPVTLDLGPGRGSVFRVEVPIVAALPATRRRAEAPRPPRHAARRHARARDRQRAGDPRRDADAALGLGLRGHGRRPISQGALDAIRTHRIVPEVIIADYHLDEGDGLDAIRRCAGR